MRRLFNSTFVVSVSTLLAMLLVAFSLIVSTVDREVLPTIEMPVIEVQPQPEFSLETVSDDVLWLARGIYSETKQAHEQELVAWVIRNRVETKYRGKDTYKTVVLDPWQFSAFNANSPKRYYHMNLAPTSSARGFEQALRIAHEVYYAYDTVRPFTQNVRHFYSEQSMVGGKAPAWAKGKRPVSLEDRQVNPRRFRFYAAIA